MHLRFGRGFRLRERVLAMGAAVLVGLSAQVAGAQLAPVLPLDKDALQAKFESMAKEMLLPGAVVYLRNPEGELILTYGHRGLSDPAPVTVDDHIRIGSNTKTMTGTVILQLAQDKKLALTDAVSKYLPDVPNGDNITIEQLLNMRSGLFNYSTTYRMNHILDTEPQKTWTTDELLAMGFDVPPYSAPGTEFHYSNTNTILLGLIAEKLYGKPLDQVFQDQIFSTLKLTNTLLPVPGSNDMPQPFTHGYMFGSNVLTLANNAVPPDMIHAAQIGRLAPVDQTFANPSWGWAAGAGISTAKDLATYVEGLTGGAFLNAEWQKKRLDSATPIDPENPEAAAYGLAIAKFGPMYGHTGELPGYNSFMGNDPVNHFTMIVWANLAPTADGQDPATSIAKTLVGMIYAPK